MLNFASTAAAKWSSLEITHHAGSIADVAAHLPTFERWTTANAQFDWIIRQPLPDDDLPQAVPVAGVRKGYALVQHRSVIDAILTALGAAGIDPAHVDAELATTACGERMALSLQLPDRYSFDPGDGYEMALRFECLNSVDGSGRLRALVGWYRTVCLNGLVVGTTHCDLRKRHSGSIDLTELGAALTSGIAAAEEEQLALSAWRRCQVDLEHLARWVDTHVRKAWGFKEATRAWHIIRSGNDVAIAGSYKGRQPTTIAVEIADPVPGAPARSDNLYDVSQALAWLARQRHDFRDQFHRRDQIPALLGAL